VPEPNTIGIFLVAALLFAVVPGPAVVYVVTRSIAQGRAGGIASTLGIETGNMIHVAAAALGLSALLASSALAFAAIKYVGAAYLIYLGVRKILDRSQDDEKEKRTPEPLNRLYLHGVAVAVLNPKTALFFLAFLPQFVDPARGPISLQLAVLGVLLVAVTALSDGVYALLAGTAGNWFRGNARFMRRQRVISGGVYITLGIAALLAGSRAVKE